MSEKGARRRPGRPDPRAGFGLVETLVALTIAAIGLTAVAGLHVAVIQQERIASWRTGQTLAAQQVFEEMQSLGFGVGSRSDTVRIGGVLYTVSTTVASTSRVSQVTSQVSGVGTVDPQTFTTRVYRPRTYPVAP